MLLPQEDELLQRVILQLHQRLEQAAQGLQGTARFGRVVHLVVLENTRLCLNITELLHHVEISQIFHLGQIYTLKLQGCLTHF